LAFFTWLRLGVGVGVGVGVELGVLHRLLLLLHLDQDLRIDLRPHALREGLRAVLGVGLADDVGVRVRAQGQGQGQGQG
jgi:hypothetical protein